MKFKEWLLMKEVGTSTSCIAGFSRIAIPMVTRTWPSYAMSDEKKKKRKEQPQVKE